MISFDEAALRVRAAAHPLGSERVPIARALGRVLAAPVVARVDAPPCDISAMDGYAVRSADLPGRLRVVGEAYAGAGFDHFLKPGSCARIFTGAPLPLGADRVVIQELVSRDGDLAILPEAGAGGDNIRRRGLDFRVGQEVLRDGTLITPRALVAVAGADVDRVEVWRRPRVQVLSTGSELVPPGRVQGRKGVIPESVSWGVAALAEQWGAQAIPSRLLGDDLPALQQAAGETIEQAVDVIVVTGGASVGERDFAKAMFEPHRLALIFSKVAIKPGKPVWLGRAGGSLILGLPGNPTSAMVTARLFLAPLVARMVGRADALDWGETILASQLPPCGDRETFIRARRAPAGAAPIGNQDSSAQLALAEAELLLRMRPHDPARQVGERVEALPF